MSSKMITLKEARMVRGCSLEVTADQLGMPVSNLEWYESNPHELPLKIAQQLMEIYKTDVDDVHFGKLKPQESITS